MNRILIAASLLLLVCGTIATLLCLRPTEGPPPPTLPTADPVGSRPVAEPASRESTPIPRNEHVVREQLEPALQSDPASFAQGIKGRVVDDRSAPVAGATVWLLPGLAAGDLFALIVAQQRGTVFPPLAQVKTDAQGLFAVGIERPGEPAVRELRVVAEHLVDGKLSNLHSFAGEWHDVGTIQLSRGAVVEGTVTRAGDSKTPVADAEVSLRPQGNLIELAHVPGREHGLTAHTDELGRYRIEGAPPGVVTLAAVAPGFARNERPGQSLAPDSQTRCDFELLVGKEIVGTVVDGKGRPIELAQVTAIAISSKATAVVTARSGRGGAFEILGLVEGSYQLSVVSEGFARAEVKPVEAGTAGLQITLETLGTVQVQVYGKTGRLLSEYDATVRSVFAGQESYGATPIPTKHVRTRAGKVGTVEGLEASGNDYVLQIEAKGHARGFSAPFKVVPGQEPPLVTVRLDDGGVLEGRVLWKTGAPLPGVEVATLPFFMPDGSPLAVCAMLAPSNITRASVRTAEDGKFRIPLLNAGKYFLKLTHPEHFDILVKDLELQTGQTLTLPDIRMQSGTLIAGIVRVDGAAAGQVRVTVSGVADPSRPQAGSFFGEATTSGDGAFKVTKRLPPGRYQVAASRTNVDPFTSIFDMNKSKREIEVDSAQGQLVVELQIPTK